MCEAMHFSIRGFEVWGLREGSISLKDGILCYYFAKTCRRPFCDLNPFLQASMMATQYHLL